MKRIPLLGSLAQLKNEVEGRKEGVRSASRALARAEDELANATVILYLVEIVNPIRQEWQQTAKIVAISEHVRRRIGPFAIELDPPRNVAVYLKHIDDCFRREFRIFWPVGQELNFTEQDDDEECSECREHRACCFRTLEEAEAFRDRVLPRK